MVVLKNRNHEISTDPNRIRPHSTSFKMFITIDECVLRSIGRVENKEQGIFRT